MPSATGGVIDRSVGHSAYYPPFRSLLPQISFCKLLSAFRISANYQHPYTPNSAKLGSSDAAQY